MEIDDAPVVHSSCNDSHIIQLPNIIFLFKKVDRKKTWNHKPVMLTSRAGKKLESNIREETTGDLENNIRLEQS